MEVKNVQTICTYIIKYFDYTHVQTASFCIGDRFLATTRKGHCKSFPLPCIEKKKTDRPPRRARHNAVQEVEKVEKSFAPVQCRVCQR